MAAIPRVPYTGLRDQISPTGRPPAPSSVLTALLWGDVVCTAQADNSIGVTKDRANLHSVFIRSRRLYRNGEQIIAQIRESLTDGGNLPAQCGQQLDIWLVHHR
ncbi:hypothetical protein GCM10007052_21280 [Halioglobus japonicus]|nr:hypothetical protein GCM10007052_21280 [Halioglobus japonicus]